MKSRLKNWALNWVIKNLLNGVTLKDTWQKSDSEKWDSYKILAEELQNDALFNKLLDELDYIACIKMFRKSQTPDDIVFGKALLYNNDLLRKKVKLMAGGHGMAAKDLGR